MELYYSKGANACLIWDLQNYLSDREINTLFKDLNFIYFYEKSLIFKNMINNKINRVRDLLIYMMQKKLKKAYQKGDISEKLYLLKIKKYINSINKDLKHIDNYQLVLKK